MSGIPEWAIEHQRNDDKRFDEAQRDREELRKRLSAVATKEDIIAIETQVALLGAQMDAHNKQMQPIADGLSAIGNIRIFSLWFAPLAKFLTAFVALGAVVYWLFHKS